MTSITETPNEFTSDLDIVGPAGLLKLLRQSDAQLFSGYKHYPCIYDKEITTSVVELIKSIVEALAQATKEGKKVKVVLSGAGTSGRIAFFVARAFNKVFPANQYFHYLIAGGDKALIVGQEGSEDDTNAAVVDLQKIVGNEQGCTVVYVGITCGFSAPYVASQLEHLFSLADAGNTNVISVLMGFNPVEFARKNKIENWHASFSSVALEMQNRSSI